VVLVREFRGVCAGLEELPRAKTQIERGFGALHRNRAQSAQVIWLAGTLVLDGEETKRP
jgi:hypothetical protein